MKKATLCTYSTRKNFGYSAIILLLSGLALFVVSQTQSVQAQNSLALPSALSGYAWSSNVGWLSFNSANETAAIGSHSVDRDASGNLNGYAWSPNIGWVKFGALETQTMPTISAAPGTQQVNAKVDIATGRLIGWARACAGMSDPVHCTDAATPADSGSTAMTPLIFRVGSGPNGQAPASTDSYSTSYSWTVPEGWVGKEAIVRVWGAGGGGSFSSGSYTSAGFGAGGGGGYSEKRILFDAPINNASGIFNDQRYAISVGKGGPGGSSVGTDGRWSTFGNLGYPTSRYGNFIVRGEGGKGGGGLKGTMSNSGQITYGAVVYGKGGTASGGDVNYTGHTGAYQTMSGNYDPNPNYDGGVSGDLSNNPLLCDTNQFNTYKNKVRCKQGYQDNNTGYYVELSDGDLFGGGDTALAGAEGRDVVSTGNHKGYTPGNGGAPELRVVNGYGYRAGFDYTTGADGGDGMVTITPVVTDTPVTPPTTVGDPRGGWYGWISLSGLTAAGNYGVQLGTDGKYVGYAWGADVIGWLQFGGNPNPVVVPPPGGGGGGGGGCTGVCEFPRVIGLTCTAPTRVGTSGPWTWAASVTSVFRGTAPYTFSWTPPSGSAVSHAPISPAVVGSPAADTFSTAATTGQFPTVSIRDNGGYASQTVSCPAVPQQVLSSNVEFGAASIASLAASAPTSASAYKSSISTQRNKSAALRYSITGGNAGDVYLITQSGPAGSGVSGNALGQQVYSDPLVGVIGQVQKVGPLGTNGVYKYTLKIFSSGVNVLTGTPKSVSEVTVTVRNDPDLYEF